MSPFQQRLTSFSTRPPARSRNVSIAFLSCHKAVRVNETAMASSGLTYAVSSPHPDPVTRAAPGARPRGLSLRRIPFATSQVPEREEESFAVSPGNLRRDLPDRFSKSQRSAVLDKAVAACDGRLTLARMSPLAGLKFCLRLVSPKMSPPPGA